MDYKKIWLEKRLDELKTAIDMKSNGSLVIWTSPDYCVDINKYIKERINLIYDHYQKENNND